MASLFMLGAEGDWGWRNWVCGWDCEGAKAAAGGVRLAVGGGRLAGTMMESPGSKSSGSSISGSESETSSMRACDMLACVRQVHWSSNGVK